MLFFTTDPDFVFRRRRLHSGKLRRMRDVKFSHSWWNRQDVNSARSRVIIRLSFVWRNSILLLKSFGSTFHRKGPLWKYPPQKKKITFSTFCLAQFELEYETFYWMGIIIFVIYCAAYTRAYYFFSLLFIIFKSKCIIHSLCLYFLFRVLK